MGDVIQSAVACDSVYGVVGLTVISIVIICLTFIAYKALLFVFPYIYKIICKLTNTTKTYNKVHTKIGTDDVSIETDLDR
jgi:uncharacterized membrane protein YedE/YeeE